MQIHSLKARSCTARRPDPHCRTRRPSQASCADQSDRRRVSFQALANTTPNPNKKVNLAGWVGKRALCLPRPSFLLVAWQFPGFGQVFPVRYKYTMAIRVKANAYYTARCFRLITSEFFASSNIDRNCVRRCLPQGCQS
jgi:hypothetical protein